MAVANEPSTRLDRERDRLEGESGVTSDEVEAITDVIDNLGKATSTQAAYLMCLRVFAAEVDGEITELSPDELDAEYKALADRKDSSDSTKAQYQSALRAFVRRHYDDEAAEKIDVTNANSNPSIDPRTVLNPDEYHAMRDVASKDRDRAVIDLFAYTGQRLRVIQTLRYKDVDVEEGVYYMPEGFEGLKGADKHGKKRPLLGARKSVEEWKRSHPTKNPDDALITVDPEDTGGGTPGDELGPTTIQGILQRLAARADVDKPVNPHAWRHFFVTIAKTQYDLEDGTIKWLIGHSPGSKIMETTYAHLSDDDHISDVRGAMGLDSDDDETTMAPPVCPTCSRPLPPDAEKCPSAGCREVFTPTGTALDLSDERDEAVRGGYREADEMDTVEKLQLLDSLLDDPDVRAMMDEHNAETA